MCPGYHLGQLCQGQSHSVAQDDFVGAVILVKQQGPSRGATPARGGSAHTRGTAGCKRVHGSLEDLLHRHGHGKDRDGRDAFVRADHSRRGDDDDDDATATAALLVAVADDDDDDERVDVAPGDDAAAAAAKATTAHRWQPIRAPPSSCAM